MDQYEGYVQVLTVNYPPVELIGDPKKPVYLPKLARIADIKDEVPGARGIKTFFVEFPNGDGFEHECGQCAMISVFGKGESMISIASAPAVKEYKQFSIMRTGRVTTGSAIA